MTDNVYSRVRADIAEWQQLNREVRAQREPISGGPAPLAPARRPGTINYRSCYECSAPCVGEGHVVRCRKCQAKYAATRKPLDPQKGSLVYVQPIAIPERWAPCSGSQWLVVSRSGDEVEIQLVGIPQSRFTTTVMQLADHDVTPWHNGNY